MGALVGGWLFGSLKWHEWKLEVHSRAHLTPRARVVRIVPEILQDLFLFRARHRGSTARRSIPGNKKCTAIFSAATFLRILPLPLPCHPSADCDPRCPDSTGDTRWETCRKVWAFRDIGSWLVSESTIRWCNRNDYIISTQSKMQRVTWNLEACLPAYEFRGI